MQIDQIRSGATLLVDTQKTTQVEGIDKPKDPCRKIVLNKHGQNMVTIDMESTHNVTNQGLMERIGTLPKCINIHEASLKRRV